MSSPEPANRTSRRKFAALVCTAIVSIIGITAAQLSRYAVGGNVLMDVGNVAPRDIRSPRQITYISDIETARQRDLASASVLPIFTSPDAQIARQQLNLFRDVMSRIAETRNSNEDETIRLQQLTALSNLTLSENEARLILSIDDQRWARVNAQVVSLLDEVLRTPIRPDNLNSAKATLPGMISLEFNPEEAAVISALASAMLVPNTSYETGDTDKARAAAREAVRPIERTFEANQIIVRSGQIITPLDVEALEKLNMYRPALTWPDLGNAILMSALAVSLVGAAMLHGKDNAFARRTQRTVLSATFLVLSVMLARLLMPGNTLLPYLVPMSAVGIVITSWSGVLPGVVGAVTLAGLVSIPMDQPLEFAVYWAVGGVIGGLVLRRGERISDFFRAGLASGIFQVCVVVAFYAAGSTFGDWVQVGADILAAAVGNLLTAALAPAILYVTGLVFDIVTPIQLIELSRPSHPLLQQMLTQAPGTYHHSLMVANLAEQAAERIGADSLLTRVGAYYHDVGKTLHPYFFIENQVDTGNVHDQLDPQTSSRILQNHVVDGLALARRFRLPTRVAVFVTEHHGTGRTNYQYALATRANGEQPVDEVPFRYPGPRPQSQETALVMLADGCEAAVRARKPASIEHTDEVLRKVIGERLADHQLDDTSLTLQELELIRQSFHDTLRGAYHPRVEYPDVSRPSASAASISPAEPLAQPRSSPTQS